MKVDLGHGIATFIAPRRDGGVTIHQGKSHIMLAPDELAAVLDAIHALSGLSSRAAAEKTTKVDVQQV